MPQSTTQAYRTNAAYTKTQTRRWKNVNGSFDEALKLTHKTQLWRDLCNYYYVCFIDLWQSWDCFLFFSSSIFACFAAEQNRAIEKVVGQIFKLIMLLQTWRNVLWCPNKFLLFFFSNQNCIAPFYYYYRHATVAAARVCVFS